MISFVCLICLLTGSVQWGFLQNFEKMIYNYSVMLKPHAVAQCSLGSLNKLLRLVLLLLP